MSIHIIGPHWRRWRLFKRQGLSPFGTRSSAVPARLCEAPGRGCGSRCRATYASRRARGAGHRSGASPGIHERPGEGPYPRFQQIDDLFFEDFTSEPHCVHPEDGDPFSSTTSWPTSWRWTLAFSHQGEAVRISPALRDACLDTAGAVAYTWNMQGNRETTESAGSPQGQARRRGRPQQFTSLSGEIHLSLSTSIASLSPTARAMLDAGRRLLSERGFRGLTLEAVALEAGASKTSVVSHFGNRAGYLAILFDALIHDGSCVIAASLDEPPRGADHVTNWMRMVADLYEDVESGRAYHEIAANAFGDDALRRRLARVFEWYREMGVQRLSTCEGSSALTAEELGRLSALLNAVEDGLALQRGMDPEGFESRPVFELFGYLLQLYFSDAAGRSR